MATLPPDIKPALQGVYPSCLISASADGTPNASSISQVFWVDETHVALSHQFFNKTKRNVAENPKVNAFVICPETTRTWDLQLEFERAETDGPIFEAMDMQLEAIASMVGMKDVFKLRSADVYKVVGVWLRSDERLPRTGGEGSDQR